MAARWDDLQAFLAVARAGQLTAAARRMGVEHATLSRRITRLEADLGVSLFDRGPTGYDLTLDGHSLVPRAEQVERIALGIWSGQPDRDAGLTGTVRVGAPEAVGTFCLAERIGELALTHPSLSIELIATPRAFSLSKREADLAIGLSPPATGRLHGRRISNYELGLYGSITYLDRFGTPVTLDDLKMHRYVGYIDDLIFSPELDYFAGALPGLEPSIRISNVITQMIATQSGAGLCILPCFMADRQADLVRVTPDIVKIVRAYWLLTHSDLRKLRRIRVASDFIGTILRENKAKFMPSSS